LSAIFYFFYEVGDNCIVASKGLSKASELAAFLPILMENKAVLQR
jgi:hypothetical protein